MGEDKNTGKIHRIIPVLIMIFIFVQSAFPADLSSRESGLIVSLVRHFWDADPETITYAVRKCAHFIEYSALGWSLLLPVTNRFGRCGGLYAWVFGSLYAVTDEIHQIFVEGRSCELGDILLDSAGVLTGLLIAFALSMIRAGKQNHKHKEEAK